MPISSREMVFIEPFLAAYEDGTWANARLTKPDAVDRLNPAVDVLAVRLSDGKRLAIEHTIIQPFVEEKADYVSFVKSLFQIESDISLAIPNRHTQVFVPVGTLKKQPGQAREAIAGSVHNWIREKRLTLRDGTSQYDCPLTIPGQPPGSITLTVKQSVLQRQSPGVLHVRRQQVGNSLDKVVNTALSKKLPKLLNTEADKRLLMLERQHMNLLPEQILDEIQKARPMFPALASIDEIWILETPFYGTPFRGTHFGCELYKDGEVVETFTFNDGKLLQ